MSELEEYIKERDEVVKNNSLNEFIKWASSKGCNFTNALSAEISLHKLRTAIDSAPLEMKLASDKWLRDRGYVSWMDPKPK